MIFTEKQIHYSGLKLKLFFCPECKLRATFPWIAGNCRISRRKPKFLRTVNFYG